MSSVCVNATVTVSLFAASTTELGVLASFMQGLRADDPMPAGTLADDATAVSAMSDLIANPSLGRVWMIQLNDAPVGYAVLTFVHSIEFGGKCAFIDELYVEPDARGRGVGQSAIKLIAVEAKKLQVRLLLLEVSPENERAARLYGRVGFVPRKYRLMTQLL